MSTYEEAADALLMKHDLPRPWPHYRDKVTPAKTRRYLEAAPDVFTDLNDQPEHGERLARAYGNLMWEHHKVAHVGLWATVEKAFFTTTSAKAREEIGTWLRRTVEKRPEYTERLVQVIERTDPLAANQLILQAEATVDQEQWDRIAPKAMLRATRKILRQWRYTAPWFADRPVDFWLPPTILDNMLEQILTQLEVPFPLPMREQLIDDDILHSYVLAAPAFIRDTASLPEHIRTNFLLQYFERIGEHIKARHRKWWDDFVAVLDSADSTPARQLASRWLTTATGFGKTNFPRLLTLIDKYPADDAMTLIAHVYTFGSPEQKRKVKDKHVPKEERQEVENSFSIGRAIDRKHPELLEPPE